MPLYREFRSLEFFEKDKKLFGGIIANSQDDYSGVWYCFDKPIKEWQDGMLGNWTRLEL